MLVVWLSSHWAKCKNTFEEYRNFCLLLSISWAPAGWGERGWGGEGGSNLKLITWSHGNMQLCLCSLQSFVRLAAYHLTLNRIPLRKRGSSSSGLIMLKSLLWSLRNKLNKYIHCTGNACSFGPVQLWLIFWPHLPLLYFHSVTQLSFLLKIVLNKCLEYFPQRIF